MKILLTGGAGFIGSHVADALLADGHQLLIIDDLSGGARTNLPHGAAFEQIDIRDRESLARAFAQFAPQAVNHHAAQIDVRASTQDPQTDAQINIIGSLNLLELCAEHRVQQFIFASSAAVYGEPRDLPAREDAPLAPASPYGIAKLCVEHYAAFFAHTRNIAFSALRYANVYGERQATDRDTGILSILCGNHRNDAPSTLFGDGKQTRDYVHVADVARANVLCLRAPCQVCNISTAQQTSLLDLVEELAHASKRAVKINHAAGKPGDVANISLSNARAADALDWTPQITLAAGVARVWQWAQAK